MTRLLILAAIILSIVSYASSQVVDAINTPLGPVTQGAKVSVSWTLIAGVDATGKTADLSATDSATKNVIPIDPAVPLAPKSYLWEVKVPPGTYTLGLNDGAGLKQSGEVVVKAPAGGAPPAAGPPAAGTPPATPPATPPTTQPPAGKAPAPAPAPSGSSDNTPPPAGSTPSAAPSPSSGAATTPASASASTGSAIFSGYEVVFSLLGVAIAMVQF